jgi:hypothetical protein
VSSDCHAPFTPTTITGVSIVAMFTSIVRSLVGDFESEYDEFDRDTEIEADIANRGWLEPSW